MAPFEWHCLHFVTFILMKIYLDEQKVRPYFWPLTQIRSVGDLRLGITTLREKWMYLTGEPLADQPQEADAVIPANQLPPLSLLSEPQPHWRDEVMSHPEHQAFIPLIGELPLLQHDYLIADIHRFTRGRSFQQPDESNRIFGPHPVYIDAGAVVRGCTFNTEEGPIWIDQEAQVMEGSLMRGPVYIGKQAVVKMGTRIYGATLVGRQCTVGGEIKNSQIGDFSNKAHDGYLGDSILGTWCNLGAGTSCSNVKNTGGRIRYSFPDAEIRTGRHKGGLIMGDFSRCGINTSFPTGCLVGVCCQISGKQTLPTLIPNLSWDGRAYDREKAVEHILNWMKMKGIELSDTELAQLSQTIQNIPTHA